MANCAECSVKMGYTESNVARDHEGMCVACYVKSLVKQKLRLQIALGAQVMLSPLIITLKNLKTSL